MANRGIGYRRKKSFQSPNPREDTMSKTQWKNLWHSYRWQRRASGVGLALAWIACYNRNDVELIRRVIL